MINEEQTIKIDSLRLILGKLISVVIISILIGIMISISEEDEKPMTKEEYIQNYESYKTDESSTPMTKEEYIQNYDSYLTEVNEEKVPIGTMLIVVFMLLIGLFVIYEILGLFISRLIPIHLFKTKHKLDNEHPNFLDKDDFVKPKKNTTDDIINIESYEEF